MKNPEYYASTTPNTRFNFGPFATPQEACEACYKDYRMGGNEAGTISVVFCGTLSIHVPQIFADDIVESLSVQATGDCGEVAEVWPDSTKMERQRLQDALNLVIKGWLAEIGQEPEFGAMQDVLKYARSQDGRWTPL